MTPTPPSRHQLHLNQLATYLREAEQILTDWDTYSDQHTDADGWPLDTLAYDLRQRRRDAQTWRAFYRISYCADDLLTTAETQLGRIPETHRQPRWAWQLAELRTCLKRLHALQTDWQKIRESLPRMPTPAPRHTTSRSRIATPMPGTTSTNGPWAVRH